MRYLVEGIIEDNVKEVPARTLIGKKNMFYQSIKNIPNVRCIFFLHITFKSPRTFEKCRKYSPAARVFYTSLVFSNALRVLLKCNTRLPLL